MLSKNLKIQKEICKDLEDRGEGWKLRIEK
jgi:hypothetical protein